MLFDLRGRGRRRTIQVIYLVLALILGGGLIFFGVGGASNGGLLNAVGANGTTGSATDIFANNEKAAAKKAAATPKDPAVWAALAHARYQVAGSGSNFNTSTQTFTASGKAELAKVKQAWDQYLALKPAVPNSDTAREMVQVLGPAGLNSLPDAIAAEEIVVNQNPTSAAEYARLALLAYLAGQSRTGDLASAQAVTLAPKDQQAALKQELTAAKTQAQAGTAAKTLSTTSTPQLPSG